MRRKSFGQMACPVARSLERVGEGWSFLILRDALNGLTRFEEFQSHLGIAPTTLTRRLDAMVADGLLERRRYAERPPRDEYVLTDRGRDFRPVVIALLAWGNRHFAPEGRSAIVIDARSGREAEPMLVDAVSGRPISDPEFTIAPGPAASAEAHRRWAARRGNRDAGAEPASGAKEFSS
jgi:DNA-binding HxlR family transcriptional regulator